MRRQRPDQESQVISARQLAAALGLTPNALYKRVRRGQLSELRIVFDETDRTLRFDLLRVRDALGMPDLAKIPDEKGSS